jgi:hypothetical protein
MGGDAGSLIRRVRAALRRIALPKNPLVVCIEALEGGDWPTHKQVQSALQQSFSVKFRKWENCRVFALNQFAVLSGSCNV